MKGDFATMLKKPRILETWSDAPQDILSLISSKLTLNDRHHFKLVCKSWNSAVPNTPLPLRPQPCLMYSQQSSDRWKLFRSLHNDFCYLDFPELKGAEIQYSKDGWLLMSRHKSSRLFFFNPLTRTKFELPPTNQDDCFYSVCFTSRPTCSDCFVFGIFSSSDGVGRIRFGDGEWKLEFFQNFERFGKSNCPPLFYNGVYYCLRFSQRNFFVFDPTGDGVNRWLPCGDPICNVDEEEEHDYAITREVYLARVEEELWGVFVTKDDRRVNVMKWDFTDSCWVELESLGDYCLYVSTCGSFAEKCGSTSEMANKIYFNKFHGKSGVWYCLTSGMYHSVDGDFASSDAYGLTHMAWGTWFKPTLDKF